MTPTERVYDEEFPSEEPLPWSTSRDATFQSYDDPALIISNNLKRKLLKKLADRYAPPPSPENK